MPHSWGIPVVPRISPILQLPFQHTSTTGPIPRLLGNSGLEICSQLFTLSTDDRGQRPPLVLEGSFLSFQEAAFRQIGFCSGNFCLRQRIPVCLGWAGLVIPGAPWVQGPRLLPWCPSPFSLGLGAAVAKLGQQDIGPLLVQGSLALPPLRSMGPCPKAALGTQISLPRRRAFWLAAHVRFQFAGRCAARLRPGQFVDYRLPGASPHAQNPICAASG